jgi:hypothetical protein
MRDIVKRNPNFSTKFSGAILSFPVPGLFGGGLGRERDAVRWTAPAVAGAAWQVIDFALRVPLPRAVRGGRLWDRWRGGCGDVAGVGTRMYCMSANVGLVEAYQLVGFFDHQEIFRILFFGRCGEVERAGENSGGVDDHHLTVSDRVLVINHGLNAGVCQECGGAVLIGLIGFVQDDQDLYPRPASGHPPGLWQWAPG